MNHVAPPLPCQNRADPEMDWNPAGPTSFAPVQMWTLEERLGLVALEDSDCFACLLEAYLWKRRKPERTRPPDEAAG